MAGIGGEDVHLTDSEAVKTDSNSFVPEPKCSSSTKEASDSGTNLQEMLLSPREGKFYRLLYAYR
jgi:hypothetical protein